MTVTFTNLSGSRENLDKTIADLISDNWTASNITGSITPYFASDTDEPDQLARADGSFVNEVRVNYSSRTKYDGEDFEVNGDDKHAWVCTCFIEIQGESLQILLEMEDEIHRILWENRPNGSTRLNKSTGAASEVAFFEEAEPEFERLEPDDEVDQTPTSQAELKMVYFKIKT
jgi:hypothetical protein|tara:strand:- start:4114 stop:4632 length:519 start_codon:yes stop_codon:yes gene_type:complete